MLEVRSPALPPCLSPQDKVRSIGEWLFARMDQAPAPALFTKKGLYGRLMEWSMKDPAFKTQLFRFVDVLPSLDSPTEIIRHLQEYLGDRAVELSPALNTGLVFSGLAPGLIANPVKANVAAMARQFVAGETVDRLIERIRHNRKAGVATTIDLLGETVLSEQEADRFVERNLEILNEVSAWLAKENAPCFSDMGPIGGIPQLNLSIKVSALAPDVNPADPEGSLMAIEQRLRPILRRAAEVDAFINFDMESYRLKPLTLALFKSVAEAEEFREKPRLGIALQAYLRDCETDVRNLITWARSRKRVVGIRLVKGAYWDYETIHARQQHWPVPVWSQKAQSDVNFEKLSGLLLRHLDVVAPAFASHNVRSVAQVIAESDLLGLDRRAYEFQALYGMADELKHALREGGYRVREYCPVGDLLPGMAYLVRRLLENTSNEGFLRTKHTGAATRQQLLQDPAELVRPEALTPLPQGFSNAPNTDFSRMEAQVRMRAALKRTEAKLGRRWPLVIGKKQIADRELIASRNPSRPAHVVGYWARATVSDANAAVAEARAALPNWRATPAEERARVLDRTAELIGTRRFELNALAVFEAGKPWPEADADISEAIDFCRFYAAEMRRLDRVEFTQVVPGERCVRRWTPRGIGVVIAPWNFPLAILCGLTVAPVVAGNTVVMKPAEQTSIIAATFTEILHEAGLPPGVVNFLPGYGDDVGAHLVQHADVDFVAFTGSRAVGLKIWEAAGQTHPGQRNLKKVVCEMGGKNALIIDNDADLDEAIPGAMASAFGFSGQKCSALSLLIVLDEIHDRFVERFVAACAGIKVGDPALPGTVVGPVIDAEARQKILGLIEQGARDARLAFQGVAPAEGYFVPPTVFTHVQPGHAIAREEIFGPVVAILRANNLDEAFALVNDSDYALTGGMYSRSPTALARAENELLVGNLYLNRGITGAIVERHPFGGLRLSGGGTKAGGTDYLQNFMFPRVIAENVMRRGFTPDEG